jgi:hypothetical protein
MDQHQTPEEAAMVGFPPQYVRVVATRIDGDDAYVLLDTGPRNQPYLYGVNCKRGPTGWREMSSGNGGSWSLSDEEHSLGTWALWDDAPRGAGRIEVEFEGETTEHPVADGFYLVVFFRRPAEPGPKITGFRINPDR